jgi:hypothetical protein
MEKIVKIPNAVSSFIVENGARVQEKGAGVMNIKLKPGVSEPVDIITDIVARLADANPDLVVTAAGITPVPYTGGAVFNGLIAFAPRSKFFEKV